MLLVATCLAYQPAWHGGFLWDDDHHVTPAELRSAAGLARIWVEMGATLQYYPLLHSTFWALSRLFGDNTLGYHLVNLGVHGLAVVLVLVTLRRLAIPGALFAAALFAVHPIQVESVAWITELKNTLSTVFYFSAALAYLRFDRTRSVPFYLAALAVFVMALLTKTVTGMLPFGLLVALWWRSGRLSLKRDVIPLVPFIVVGVLSGLLTAWWEVEFNRTGSAAFSLSLPERVIIAGRACVHQLANLIWPAHLLFSYPRWEIDAASPAQYAYPAAMAALLAAAWRMRRWSRAPLAALLFFGITLAPTLGIFNLYTFRYSFVADHYQYVACIGIFALAAGGLHLLMHQRTFRPIVAAGAVGVLALLTIITWRQSANYASAEVSYRAVIAGNPDSWFGHANLGATLIETSPDQAVEHLTKAIQLKPDLAEAHSNLAMAYLASGRPHDAADAAARALVFDSRLPGARRTLADALRLEDRLPEAIAQYRQLLEMQPTNPDAHDGLGLALAATGRLEEAGLEHQRAIDANPSRGQSYYFLGNLLQTQGRHAEAVRMYERALPLLTTSAELRNNLGVALELLGRDADAERHYREAIQLSASLTDATFNLATLLGRTHRPAEAVPYFKAVLLHEPDDYEIRLDYAVILVELGRRREAIEQLRAVVGIEPTNRRALATLQRALDLPDRDR